MREIEFRGKTIKGGEWKYGDLVKTNGATGDGWAIQYYDPESGWIVEDVQERTIGQSGLRADRPAAPRLTRVRAEGHPHGCPLVF